MIDIKDKSIFYKKIEQFMQKAEQNCPTEPSKLDSNVSVLRARVVAEEFFELMNALGICISVSSPNNCSDISVEMDLNNPLKNTIMSLNYWHVKDTDLVATADGCADLAYVTGGTLVACGIPDLYLYNMVADNNLDKFGPGHFKDEYGKLMKPPGHQPPDIAGFINKLKGNN